MCRSIKQLRQPGQPATEAEIHAAALQFVRKVSGFRAPSRANQAAFDAAVTDIATITQRLLEHFAPPLDARSAGHAGAAATATDAAAPACDA
jgi:hypothetical protein